MQEIDATGRDEAFPPTPQWICALHVDLVGRIPDQSSLGRWLTVGRTRASHREITCDLLRSPDYCRAQISALYRCLLDRDADPAGLAAWTGLLQSGIALQDVIVGFCDGSEYKTNQPDGPALVDSLYHRLLRRAPDPESKTASLAQLDSGASTASLIRGFLSSTEYCAMRATELHEALLGRAPSKAELSQRTLELMHGAPVQQIVFGLVTSAEYIARAATRSLPDPDADIVSMIGDGQLSPALERLMQRHGAAIYRYCRASINDTAMADDIHQQVFISAYRDLPKFAGRSTLRTWLLGIARHRVLDAAKQQRRVRSRFAYDLAVDPPDPAPSLGDSLDDAQLRAALAACIAQLEEPSRTGVLMRFQQGLSYEEIAAICGDKPGTLQARVARGLRRLRALIEDHLAPRPVS